MQPARYRLAIFVSLALITGLFYSQVCALNCAVYGCLTPASATARSEQQPGHCHEQESKSDSPKPDDSPDCPAHSELSALISTTVIKVAAFNLSMHAPAAVPEITVVANPSPGDSLPRSDQISFRAPPTHSILRI